MSLLAYCRIEGEVQGLITEGNLTEESVGQAWQVDHEDEIQVQSFRQEVTMPRDAASGEATGKRRNGPVVITKEIDKCAPLLHKALYENEQLSKVEFTFFRTAATGVQEKFFTIALEDAYVATIRDLLPDLKEADSARFPMVQEVGFAFRRITWSHELASTMATDEWRNPDL